MFGWFRKRTRPEAAAVDAPAAQPLDHAPVTPQAPARVASAIVTPQHSSGQSGSGQSGSEQSGSEQLAPERGRPAQGVAPAFAPPVAAPSLRPAMPLSDHPNFAGLGLAQPDLTPPRLLDPEAALSDEAREELTTLLLDMFGPRGRYRLEWRADREPGDDAMFSQIMVADLVRRIQNSIAIASDLELRASPLRLAIEAMDARFAAMDADDDVIDDETAAIEAPPGRSGGPTSGATNDANTTDINIERDVRSVVTERDAAITAVLAPRDTLDGLAAPEPSHRDASDVGGDRRIA